jgi:hypothetical protein
MGEATAVRTMSTTLGDAAAELGGGHARHLAVRYLTLDMKRWLDDRCNATLPTHLADHSSNGANNGIRGV